MTTTMTKPEEAQAPKPKTKRERRSFALRFEGADGSRLTIKASRQKDGSAKTEVTHGVRDGKKWKNVRGATETHPNFEAATKRQSELAAQAMKLGWRKREARAGFARKPDAFDAGHLPAPGKTKK